MSECVYVCVLLSLYRSHGSKANGPLHWWNSLKKAYHRFVTTQLELRRSTTKFIETLFFFAKWKHITYTHTHHPERERGKTGDQRYYIICLDMQLRSKVKLPISVEKCKRRALRSWWIFFSYKPSINKRPIILLRWSMKWKKKDCVEKEDLAGKLNLFDMVPWEPSFWRGGVGNCCGSHHNENWKVHPLRWSGGYKLLDFSSVSNSKLPKPGIFFADLIDLFPIPSIHARRYFRDVGNTPIVECNRSPVD